MNDVQRQLLDSPRDLLKSVYQKKQELEKMRDDISKQLNEMTGVIDVVKALIEARDLREKEEKENADAEPESGEVAEAVSE